jgi:isopenicillin-N epimerase
VEALRSIASFINARPSEMAFLPNATSALNTVLANVPLSPGDEVLMLDIGYGSLKKIAAAACEASGASLVLVHVPLPVRWGLLVGMTSLLCFPTPYSSTPWD